MKKKQSLSSFLRISLKALWNFLKENLPFWIIGCIVPIFIVRMIFIFDFMHINETIEKFGIWEIVLLLLTLLVLSYKLNIYPPIFRPECNVDVSSKYFSHRSTIVLGFVATIIYLLIFHEDNWRIQLLCLGITALFFFFIPPCLTRLIMKILERGKKGNTGEEELDNEKEHPIEKEEDDELGYAELAKGFMKRAEGKKSHTLAVLGKYGIGKSSFINLMLNCLVGRDDVVEVHVIVSAIN